MGIDLMMGDQSQGGPRDVHPISRTETLSDVLLQLCIRQSTRLLTADIRSHDFSRQGCFVAPFIRNGSKARIGIKTAVLSVSFCTAVIKETIVMDLPGIATHTGIGIDHSVAAGGLLYLYFYRRLYFTAIAEDIIDHAAKLRTILESTMTADDLQSLNCLQLRVEIGLRITERICGNIISILSHIEFPTAIRTQPSGRDPNLNAASIALPYLNTRDFCNHLSHDIVHYISLDIVKYDKGTFFSGINGSTHHLRHLLDIRTAVPTHYRDIRQEFGGSSCVL